MRAKPSGPEAGFAGSTGLFWTIGVFSVVRQRADADRAALHAADLRPGADQPLRGDAARADHARRRPLRLHGRARLRPRPAGGAHRRHGAGAAGRAGVPRRPAPRGAAERALQARLGAEGPRGGAEARWPRRCSSPSSTCPGRRSSSWRSTASIPGSGISRWSAGWSWSAVTLLNQMLTRKPEAEATAAALQGDAFAETIRQQGEMIQALGMRGAVLERWQAPARPRARRPARLQRPRQPVRDHLQDLPLLPAVGGARARRLPGAAGRDDRRAR